MTVCTGDLPRPLGGDPLQAGLRRPGRQPLRTACRDGRSIPYGLSRGDAVPLPATCPVLALMASIVLSAMGCLLVAPLGRSMLLAPGRLAARARAVAVTAITTAADGERLLAAQTVAQVQDGNRRRRDGHHGLQGWRSGQPRSPMRGSKRWVGPRLLGSRGTTRKPRRLPGFSFL